MKFGRTLPRNQVPEWASQYINYKALKKLIKNAQEAEKTGEQPDLAGFFYSLDRNLEDVDYFYTKKFQDLARRLKLLEDRYGSTTDAVQALEIEERDDLLAGLLELRGQFRKLLWYGEVNRRGFVKITKKLDKKIEGSYTQKKYVSYKVDPCSFAHNTELFQALDKLNSWISLLSEVVSEETATSKSTKTHRLHPTSSRQSLKIPDESWALLEQRVREDNAPATDALLVETRKDIPNMSESQFQQLLKSLLQRAIHARSRKCITLLLSQIVYLDDSEDINKRNCLHRLIISIGRAHADADKSKGEEVVDAESELYSFLTPAASPSRYLKKAVSKDDQRTSILSDADEPILFLNFLLSSLSADQRLALGSRDSAGRTPLHFAAEYGVSAAVKSIIYCLKLWNMFNIVEGIDGPFWQDNEGWAPLHLSAIGGHPITTQALLDAEAASSDISRLQKIRQSNVKSSAVLAIATKSNFIEVVRTLVKACVDINYQDEQGETALHVAARFGHVECAQILLDGSDLQKIDTELREKTYGWTPLFIASVDGHLPIVELLIEAGADLEKIDGSGWSAKEHAALRGHVSLAMRLAEVIPDPYPNIDTSSTASSSPPNPSALTERTSNGNGQKAGSETIKQFGHRYLTDKSMILVSLGTMDMRKTSQAVNLDQIPMTNASSTQLDTALSIIVSAKGAEGESEIVDLPTQDNIATEPIIFHSTDPSKVKILFDLVPTYSGNQERKVGRGAALLSSIKSNIGAKRMPLQGDLCVPIMSVSDMDVIGSITFNFLIITPFHHPKMSISKGQTYWKKMAQTMVIGHRGMGKNFARGRRSLQLGENTVESFVAAANLGASYVEFDVQLTKDHVPVIYHDFLVSETGVDAPVHTLTLEQFLHVNDSITPRGSRPPSPDRMPQIRDRGSHDRFRSMSVGGGHNGNLELEERMKHTRDFKKKGFKGNTRGNHIQAPFATLEELFKKLPSTVGFNIEMKYPMLSESQDEDMDWYAVELNSFVDTVLTKVYDLGEGRNIIFSSFNPDICLLLSFKQPSIPVLFLTDAGTSPVGDVRASSLQEAIRFTARWNLLGVVSACEPFIVAPRLVKVVKESGLVCVSYGAMNNEKDKVRLQVQQGIDAVIVDNVLNIRTGLSEDADKANKMLQNQRLSPNIAALNNEKIPSLEQKNTISESTLETEAEVSDKMSTVSINGQEETGGSDLSESPVSRTHLNVPSAIRSSKST